MTRITFPAVAVILGTVTWTTLPAAAQGPPDGQIPDEVQTRLLDRFGDEGIDADDDGVLTRSEVRSFFSERRGPGSQGPRSGKRFGRQGGKGTKNAPGPGLVGPRRGGPGLRHRRPGGPPPHGMLLKRLEALKADTPPEHFSLERFGKADIDGDGQLSDTEWRAFADEARGKMLDKLLEHAPEIDADEDGEVSDAELEAFAAEAKARHIERILERHPEADTDGDGTLSDEEFDVFKAEREAEHRAKILEQHPEADLDGDGTLSDEEATALRHDRMAKHHAGVLERHPEADTDGDGTLSREEAKAFFDAKRDKDGKQGKFGRHRHGRRPRGGDRGE